MNRYFSNPYLLILLIGDVVTLALVTLVGFSTHGTAGSAGARMLTTFIPLVLAWLLVGASLGVFNLQRASDLRQVWRPAWAMILAAPLAAWMRGVLLAAPIMPVFVVVIGGASALAMLVWRGLFGLAVNRKKVTYG